MADNDSFIGKYMGNYRLVTRLDSGSYGSVYTGKHRIFTDDPAVAIKILHAHLSSSYEHDKFILEAQLLKKLNHSHILPVRDAGIQDGLPYIVTQFASRGSLRDRLHQQPDQPLPLEEALTILSQIGEALAYVHHQHIVHRDLKPANILFDSRGEALLADFGMATALSTSGTKELGRGGTPAYMAPEQFLGMVSMKSDQYALGCIAYELVTGRKPFMVEGIEIEAVHYQHAKVTPIAPTQLNPRLPMHIEQAILTAMAKDRTNRHSDIAAFVSALRKSKKQWLDEGDAHYDAKRYEEALVAYEQALHLGPNNVVTYNHKGNILRDLKRYEEALAAYEQALCLDPNYANAYTNKGLALERFGRMKEAQQAREKARQLGYTG
jgi:serine/threonine protein kinase